MRNALTREESRGTRELVSDEACANSARAVPWQHNPEERPKLLARSAGYPGALS